MIELRTDGFDPQLRNAIRSSALRADETTFLETQENRQGTIGQNVPVSCVTGDVAYFAIFQALMMDSSTKSEFMQNTLFVFRNIQRKFSIL